MTGDSAAPVFTLTPGPAGATPATRAALSQPILHHRDLVFLALYAETVESLAALRRAGAAADVGAAVEAARGELPLRMRLIPDFAGRDSGSHWNRTPCHATGSERLRKVRGFRSRTPTHRALRCWRIIHLVKLCRM
jgi:hypothetical protein